MNVVEHLAEPETAPVRPSESADFDDFYETSYRPLARIAFGLTGSDALAEELVQETMLRVLRHWRKVSTYDKPGAWARRVLLNLATSNARRRATEARLMLRLRGGVRTHSSLEADDGAVASAIRGLPADEAKVIALHYFDDMPVQQIAAVLDRPEGTIKTLLYRARHRLADELREEEDV